MACSCRGTRTSRVCSPHCACICASAVSRRVRLFMAVKADSSAPTKTGDIDRSMSSEKRSITPYTFDSDVPPLNTRCGARAGSAKSSPSSQLTQKSFSTITLDTAMRAAVCVNASARRSGGSATNRDASFAIDSLPVRCQGTQGGLHPPRCQGQVVQQRTAICHRNAAPELCKSLWRHVLQPEAAQGLNHQSAGSPRCSHLAWRGPLEHDLHRPGFHGAAGAVRRELDVCGHLIRQSEQVGCVDACGLKSQLVLAGQCCDDGIDGRPQGAEQRAVPRLVVQPSRQSAQFVARDQSLQGLVDCSAATQARKQCRCEHGAGLRAAHFARDGGVDARIDSTPTPVIPRDAGVRRWAGSFHVRKIVRFRFSDR